MAVSRKTVRRASGVVWEGFQVSYYDEYGRRRTRTFRTLTNARGFDRVFGAVAPRNSEAIWERRRRVASVVQQYLSAISSRRDHGVRGVRPSTRRIYETHLRPFVQRFGSKPIGSITASELKSYRAALLDAAHSRQNASAAFETLRRCFRYAHEAGHLTQNPFDRIHGIKVDKHIGMPIETEDYYDRHEVSQLISWLRLRAARNATYAAHRDLTLVSLLSYAGLRISEALALERSDIDFEAMHLHVRRVAVADGTVVQVTGRRRFRRIPIAPPLKDTLSSYLDLHNGKLVFANASGALLSHAAVHSAWKLATEGASLRYLPMRSLRHFYASRLIAAGYSAFELMRFMGCDDYDYCLNRYRHLFFQSAVAMGNIQCVDFGPVERGRDSG
jgi:integrase